MLTFTHNRNFLRKKHNLNEISHLAAVSKFYQLIVVFSFFLDLVKYIVNNKVNVREIYVDTVGPPESYRNKLINIFPNINITVKPKADSLFPSVSGASILAKVKRDELLSNWWGKTFSDCCDFNGNKISNLDQGSGYPGDPKTKEFLKQVFDPVFGFPNIVRFSWSTASEMIEKSGYQVIWGAGELNNQQKIKFDRTQKNCKLLILL